MNSKGVLALILMSVMLLCSSCSKSEETTQQFNISETNVEEQVDTAEAINTETTAALVELDNDATQQFSTTEANATEQVDTLETLNTETTETIVGLDNEKEQLFEQIYCDIATSLYVDSVDINWEYEYKDDMLIIRKIKNGLGEEYKIIEITYDAYDAEGNWLDADFAWLDVEQQFEADYRDIEDIALSNGYTGPIKLYFEDETGTDYLIIDCGLMIYTRLHDRDVQDEWQYWGILDNGVLIKIMEIGPSFDNYGDDVIVSCYNFYNYSDKTQNFLSSVKVKAYQDGIECSDLVIVPDLDTEQLTDIKPGNSIYVYVPFKLRDNYTPIDIEISEHFSDKVLASRTFKIH